MVKQVRENRRCASNDTNSTKINILFSECMQARDIAISVNLGSVLKLKAVWTSRQGLRLLCRHHEQHGIGAKIFIITALVMNEED
jgi:hypothetical protein